MENIGERIKLLSYQKGYKQTDLAKLRGVTRQTISHDFRQKRLSIDIVKWYAKVFNISVEEITMLNEKQAVKLDDSFEEKYYIIEEKYYKLLEEAKTLWKIVSENGIKVDLGKFDVISLPRVSGNFFCLY